tara:strand:- start:1188 stop:1739 length:552 start_codon:yes stop_codon:yes gene_type:complete
MSELRVDKIFPKNGISAGTFNAGGIIQMKYGESSDQSTYSFNNQTFAPVTIHSVSITPTSASNKILIFGKMSANCTSNTALNFEWGVYLKRGSTVIGGNSDPGGLMGGNGCQASMLNVPEAGGTTNYTYLDSPATTSTVTYHNCLQGGESSTYACNRPTNNSHGSYNFTNTGNTSLLLMEVAA